MFAGKMTKMRAAMDRGPAVGAWRLLMASKRAEPVELEPLEPARAARPVAMAASSAAIRKGQAIKPVLKPSKMYWRVVLAPLSHLMALMRPFSRPARAARV